MKSPSSIRPFTESGATAVAAIYNEDIADRLEALCDVAERAGLHKLTSRVFTDNAASRAVHVAAGFHVGIQRRHGGEARRGNRWIRAQSKYRSRASTAVKAKSENTPSMPSLKNWRYSRSGLPP